MAGKMRWGDTLDEDTSDVLPERSVVGPDAKGYKTVTEYKKNDKGETVRMVTKTRLSKVEKKLYAVSCLTAVLAMLGHERSGSSLLLGSHVCCCVPGHWRYHSLSNLHSAATGSLWGLSSATAACDPCCQGLPCITCPATRPQCSVCRQSVALPCIPWPGTAQTQLTCLNLHL